MTRQDLSRQIALAYLRLEENGVDMGALYEEFQKQHGEGTRLFQAGCRVLKEKGEDALWIWLLEQELAFLRSRMPAGKSVPEGKTVPQGTERDTGRVVFDRQEGAIAVRNYWKANRHLSYKEAMLEVSKARPELFRQ